MTYQLQQLNTEVRTMLNEPAARLWADSEITQWLNNGQRDIARRSEDLQTQNTTVSAVVGVGSYTMPNDVIRIHRIEFTPTASTQTYVVKLVTYDEMDQVWGINQTTQSSYPYYAAGWGTPGALTVQFFPVPSQTGTFTIFYYRLPVDMVLTTDVADVPAGWDELLVLYAVYNLRRKNRDDMWKDDRDNYEAKVQDLIDVTRLYHDQASSIIRPTGAVPSWLYGNEEAWY